LVSKKRHQSSNLGHILLASIVVKNRHLTIKTSQKY